MNQTEQATKPKLTQQDLLELKLHACTPLLNKEDVLEIMPGLRSMFNEDTVDTFIGLITDLNTAYFVYNKKKGEENSIKKIKSFVFDSVMRFIKYLEDSSLKEEKEKINKYDIVSLFFGFVEWGYSFLFDLFVVVRYFSRFKNQESGSKIKDVLVAKRRGKIARWNSRRVQEALSVSFAASGFNTQDNKVAEDLREITNKIKNDVAKLNVKMIHVEDIQQIVLHNLILAGYTQVAEVYASYMSSRAIQRVKSNGEKAKGGDIVIVEDNGIENILDKKEVYTRIIFALQGLSIAQKYTVDQLYNILLKSAYTGMKRRDFNKLLVLNAKMLTEKHYDFTLFAARIFLSFIYEETLGIDFSKHVSYQKEGEKYILKDEAINYFYRNAFVENMKRGVEIKILTPKLLEFYDLEELAKHIDYKYDLDFTYLGLQTLYDRYFIVDKTGDIHYRIEAPQHFWLRVAMGLGLNESDDYRATFVYNLFDLYRKRLFCSSTPTLFNSGTLRPQLSSCYIYKVDDSLESIMGRGIFDAALLSKYAGGLGGSWTAVRGTGAKIAGTNGESQGVIPFLKIHNDMLVAVNQGGKRSGSGCAYLEVWHNDIFDFLELRRNTGDERRRTHDMNTAVWIPDLFMKRVYDRGYWTLFRSSDVPDLHEIYGKEFEEKYLQYEKMAENGEIFGQKVEALELWKQILRMLYETGHPWITFKDPCNIRSPQDHVGVVHSSNLCTEITLNTSADEIAVCNLGSIVLDNHLKDNGEIDYELLRNTIRVAIRALDNVIDINFYPVEAARRSNMRHRPIGLGFMGWHYLLMSKGIAFDSDEAVELADELTEFIAYEAYSASSDLAAERGAYETFKGSKWDRGLLPLDTLYLLEEERGITLQVDKKKRLNWDALREKIKRQGMRNSNVMAIAPTATISNIMGTSQSIEPLYSNMYVKSNLSGEFVVLNKYLVRDLEKLGLWNENIIKKIKYYDGSLDAIKEIPLEIKNIYKSAFDMDIFKIIDAAARRQKWVDQSQSLNIYIKEPDMKKLSHVYKYAWQVGLKTTYYLRSLGASSIEKSSVSKYEVESSFPQACKLGQDAEGCEACQ